MKQILFIAIVIPSIFFLRMLFRIMKETERAKNKALAQSSFSRTEFGNMYQEAKWLLDRIKEANTYAALCTVEDMLNRFADCYRHLDGFVPVVRGLADFLEKARRLVRLRDRVKPFEIRYSTEE